MDPKNIATWVAHAYVLRELVALEGGQSPEAIVLRHAAEVALRAAETALRVALLHAAPRWPAVGPTMGEVDVAAARLVQGARVPGCGSYGTDYAPVPTPEQYAYAVAPDELATALNAVLPKDDL